MKLKPSVGCRAYLAAFIATLASVAQLFAADPAAVSITWPAPGDIQYGTALGADQLNAVFTNADTGEVVTGTATYTPASGTFLNAGEGQVLSVTFTADVDQGVLVADTDKAVSINVTKATLEASIPNQTSTYGSATGDLVDKIKDLDPDDDIGREMVEYSGFVAGDTSADLDVEPLLTTTATATTSIGSLPITFATAPSDANYTVVTTAGTITITKKPLSVGTAVHDFSKIYGSDPAVASSVDLDPGDAANATGWENGDDAKVNLKQIHGVEATNTVGEYDVNLVLTEKADFLEVLKNYEITINAGIYDVTPRDVEITTNISSADPIVYGAAHPTFSASWEIVTDVEDWDIDGVDATGADATVPVAGVFETGASLNIPAANAGVGVQTVVASGAKGYGENFNIIYKAGKSFTINKAPLTLSAVNRTKITGALWPELSYSYDSADLKFGDSLAAAVELPDPVLVLDAGVVGAGDGTDAPVGLYADAIVFNAPITSDNYAVTTEPADLNVTLTPATISWSPNTLALTYGQDGGWTDADHLNAVTTTTLGDPPALITGNMVYTYKDGGGAVVAGGQPNAGAITVTATFTPTLAAAALFGPASMDVTFQVDKAVLSVTAKDATRVYGNEVPVYGDGDYTVEGWIGLDGLGDLDTKPSISDPTSSASNVDTYTLSVGGASDNNYAFTYTGGTLTITPKPTVLTWEPPADIAGAAEPITYGTLFAETSSANAAGPDGVDGSVAYTAASDYAIGDVRSLIVPGTAVTAVFKPSSPNYADSAPVTKTLVIEPLAVTVEPHAKAVDFGDDIPAMTGDADGFIPSDAIKAIFETTATNVSDVGTYFITVSYEDSLGRLANYDVNLKSADTNRLEINEAPLHVEVMNGNSVVNDLALDTEAEVVATLKVKFTGLKAEAAVLNGVALTLAQIESLVGAGGANSITIGAGDDAVTYSNAEDTRAYGAGTVADLPLLGRVLNDADMFTLTVPDYNNTTSADFTSVLTYGDNTILANYSEGDNTNGIFSVGKGTPNIVWAPVTPIVYGTAIGDDQLNAAVTDAPLLDDEGNSQGAFVYTYGGETAAGTVLEVGTHTLRVEYTPAEEDQNAYIGNSATVDIVVIKKDLFVDILDLDHIYGDPLPRIDVADTTRINIDGWVGTDNIEVFLPKNGGRQPVPAIAPAPGQTGYPATNGGAKAVLFFGQDGLAKNYNVIQSGGEMTILRRDLTVKPADLDITFGDDVELTIEYINLAPGENANDHLGATGFAYVSGDTPISERSPGVYTIYADGAYGSNYWVTHTTGTLSISPAGGMFTISDTEQVYDGTPKTVTVAAQGVIRGGVQESFPYIVTYDGEATPPTDAGSYEVVVESNSPNYDAEQTVTLVISPAPVTITFADLSATYDGAAKSASVSVDPDVTFDVTYDGAADLPINAGDYAVAASVTDSNYAGTAEATLSIAKASATLALSNLTHVEDGTVKGVDVATTPADLATVATYSQSVTAANIAFVSFHETDSGSGAANGAGLNEAADKGYTDALTAAGHNVTRVLTSGTPDVDALSDYDLVIISRSVSSGGYSSGSNADNWNSVTTPTIQLGGYVLRTSRMGYTQGTTMVDTTGPIQLKADAADHPIFDGIELTDGITGDYAGIVTWNDTVQRGVSVNTDAAGEGATVIATVATEDDPTTGGIIAMEYAAGAATTTGGTFAGNRLVLLTGSREAAGVTSETAGLYDLTEVGKAMFLNAVNYMAGTPKDVVVAEPISAGAYKVSVSIDDTNYEGTAVTAMAILPPAQITISNLEAVYDGTAKSPTVTVYPAGLDYEVTYNKSPNKPKAVGTYAVKVTLVDDLYEGSKSDTFIIKKGQAEVNFVVGSLDHPWTGPVAPSVVTNPPNLMVLITYAGQLTLPTAPGTYKAVATVVDPSWEGTAEADYVLGKGPQFINFPAIPNLDLAASGGIIVLPLNAIVYDEEFNETGLPITYTIAAGTAVLEDNILSITTPGRVVITAQQLGNEVYAAAEEKVRSFNVTGVAPASVASSTVAKLNDDGTLGITQKGQPFQELGVYSSSEVNGSYEPVLKMMLDGNGEAKFNVTAEDSQQFFQVK